MPKQPLENLSFRNLLMRVTGFVSVDGVKKTRGSLFDRPGGSWIMPTCLQPSFLPTYATWSCAGGGCCGTPRSLRGNATPSMPREWTDGLRVGDFIGRSVLGGKLAKIGLDDVRNVILSGSQAAEGPRFSWA